MHSFVELRLEHFDPGVGSRATLDGVDCWLAALVTNLVEALLESGVELVGCLAISVTVEDAPAVQSGLAEHLGLDLAVQLTGALLDIESVWSSACGGPHHEITSVVLVAGNLSWSVTELKVPGLLLLLALLVLGKRGEEILALRGLLLGVGVDDLGQILHESEVGTHSVRQASQLTELGDQCDLIPCLPVLVDKERLVWIGDVLVVPCLVVLLIADLSAVLVEGRARAHAEVDALHSVRLLVVPSKKRSD